MSTVFKFRKFYLLVWEFSNRKLSLPEKYKIFTKFDGPLIVAFCRFPLYILFLADINSPLLFLSFSISPFRIKSIYFFIEKVKKMKKKEENFKHNRFKYIQVIRLHKWQVIQFMSKFVVSDDFFFFLQTLKIHTIFII